MEGTFSLKTKSNRILLLVTFFICGTSSSVLGKQNVTSCIGQPTSVEKKYLTCLRDSASAHEIRRNFNKIQEKRHECKKCAESFPGESNFISIYDRKFLVLDMNHNPFGGYSAHIIFNEGRNRLYRVWLYPVEEDEFQIRELEPVAPNKKNVRIMTLLFNSTFSDYGL